MKKFIFITLLIYSALCPTISIGQDINSIENDAEKNKSKSQKSNSNSSSNKQSNLNNSSNFNGSGFWSLLGQSIVLVAALQENVLENESENEEITCLESKVDINISQNTNNLLIRPLIRGNWGIFSSELRLNNLYAINENKHFGYNDWQILIINFFSKERFKLRVGTGISYEKFTKTTFNENTIYLEMRPLKRISISPEARFIKDYQSGNTVKKEYNFNLDYTISQSDKLDFHLGVNASYLNLYSNNRFWTYGIFTRFILK